MNLTPEEQAIKGKLDKYVAGKPFRYNPDSETVARVIHGLAMREKKSGKQYCPCRMLSGDTEKDDQIVCPCVYHEQEIEESGSCYCKLFVAEE